MSKKSINRKRFYKKEKMILKLNISNYCLKCILLGHGAYPDNSSSNNSFTEYIINNGALNNRN